MNEQNTLQKLREHKKELYRLGVQTLSLVRLNNTVELVMSARSESNVDYIDVENIQERVTNMLEQDAHISLVYDGMDESEVINVF